MSQHHYKYPALTVLYDHVMKRVAEMSTGNFSKCANLNMQKCKNENYFILADKTSYITTFSCSDEVESASKRNVLNERDMFVLFILMWTGQNQQNQQNQHHQLLMCETPNFRIFFFPLFWKFSQIELSQTRLMRLRVTF